MDKNNYKKLRNKYLPEDLRVIFVLESPPASGRYFYNPNGTINEALFSAMMKILNFKPNNKLEGLKKFMNQGYFLVDATYRPVNRMTNRDRNRKILNGLPKLREDLKGIIKDRKVKIILVKANVCRLLEKPLDAEFNNVVNKGVIIPFPGSGHQKDFHDNIKKLL